jgi:hypothetical protein
MSLPIHYSFNILLPGENCGSELSPQGYSLILEDFAIPTQNELCRYLKHNNKNKIKLS